MRVFQNSCAITKGYRDRLRKLLFGVDSFQKAISIFLGDNYGGNHTLFPVDNMADNSFYTNRFSIDLQKLWAKENGLDCGDLDNIFLSQIEEFKPDVYYDIDPRVSSEKVLKKMPSCVKYKVAWKASLGDTSLKGYDLVVNNFPYLIDVYKKKGYKTEYFSPSFSSRIANISSGYTKPVDLLVIGTVSRHHKLRNNIINKLSSYGDNRSINIEYFLDFSDFSSFISSLPIIRGYYHLPVLWMKNGRSSIYGSEMYKKMGESKIIINISPDFVEKDRGNLRCWEILNTGACMLANYGRYPKGFIDNETMTMFDPHSDDIYKKIDFLYDNQDVINKVSVNGQKNLSDTYSKENVYNNFKNIL